MPPSAPQRPPQQGVRRLHPPPISTVVQRVRRQQSAHVEGGGKAIQDRAIGLRGVQTLGGSDPFSPTIALEPAPAGPPRHDPTRLALPAVSEGERTGTMVPRPH